VLFIILMWEDHETIGTPIGHVLSFGLDGCKCSPTTCYHKECSLGILWRSGL